MVTFFNAGRLANYIYQFCAAYSYAKKHKQEFTVPYVERDQTWHPVYFRNLRNPAYDHSRHQVFVNEKQHSYHDLEFRDEWRMFNIYLRGYFQSPLYFYEYIDEIRELLGFKYEAIPDQCALHIRRGDFLLYPDKHILPPDIYYTTALNHVYAKSGIRYIKIFSDDIPWCKENFKDEFFLLGPNRNAHFEFSEGQNELQDFEEIMNSGAIICAASTFSVLAATLSPDYSKVVVCPHEDNFFGPVGKDLDLSTMYPDYFHRIKY